MKALDPIIRDGYSVQVLPVQRELAGVLYREGAAEIYWSAERGSDSLLVRIPQDVSFALKVNADDSRAMTGGDLVALNLPRDIVEPADLAESRIREIKKRVSEALQDMKVRHSFLREGWTSFGDANEITEATS